VTCWTCPTINIILLHVVVVKVAIVIVIPGSRAGSAAAATANGGDGGIRVMLMSRRGGPGMLPVHVGGSRLGGTRAWDSERTGCVG